MGADLVEMDVRTSSDGHCVMMHDATLSRTCGVRGTVSGMKLAQVRKARLANSEPVPTLEEALACLEGRCGAILELKDDNAAAPACRAVLGMGLVADVQFSSFRVEHMAEVRVALPGARLALITDEAHSGYLAAALGLGAEAVNISAKIASASAMADIHRAGLLANAWTVNRPETMRRLASLGADGIITDRPDVLAGILGRGRAAVP
jgi:glycerophosphoryl diester phosphodiesterase